MLPKTKKEKGRRFEKFVADELKKIFNFTYARKDSGSGKFRKEDITLPDNVPLTIECKNQKSEKVNEWFAGVMRKTPLDKYPVLIYKADYKSPKIVMRASDFLNFLAGKNVDFDWQFKFLITFDFINFFNLLKYLYGKPDTKDGV